MSRFQKVRKVFSYIADRWKTTDRIEKLYFKDKWTDCISECNKAIDAGKVDYFYYYYLGLSYSQLNLLTEANDSLYEALNLEDKHNLNNTISVYRNYAKYQIALNYRKSRDYERAIHLLNRFISEDKKYINFYLLLVEIYEDLEHTEEAIKSVIEGLNIEPKNDQLLNLRNRLAYIFSLEKSEKRNGG